MWVPGAPWPAISSTFWVSSKSVEILYLKKKNHRSCLRDTHWNCPQVCMLPYTNANTLKVETDGSLRFTGQLAQLTWWLSCQGETRSQNRGGQYLENDNETVLWPPHSCAHMYMCTHIHTCPYMHTHTHTQRHTSTTDCHLSVSVHILVFPSPVDWN